MTRYQFGRVSTLALLSPLVATSFVTQVHAQDASTLASLEEVVVTARKRTESLQDVPLTVAAIGGADLERFQYRNVADVMTRIPTLNVELGGSGSGASISLRGVGSSRVAAAFDSAVALDLDGVVLSSMRILQAGFFDVRQLTVLKGPQSLYFGKSASAGVLSLASADPTPEWENGATASYEFEHRGQTLEGYTSGPLTENLGIRLAAKYSDVDRLLHNSAPNVGNPDRGEQRLNLRGTAQWNPNADLSANLKIGYIHDENDGAHARSTVYCGANGVAEPVRLLGGAVVLPAGYDCDISGRTFFLFDPAQPLAAQAPPGADSRGGIPYGDSEIFFTRLKLDQDLSPALTLSSVTGFVRQRAVDLDSYSSGGVGPATPIRGVSYAGQSFGAGVGVAYNNFDQFSQELRLASSFDGPFQFMVGAFYEARRIDFNTAQGPVAIPLLVGPDPVTGSTFDYFKKQRTDTDAYSAFGSLSYDLTDKLRLTGGVRRTKEEKVSTISVPYVHAILAAGPAFIDSGFESGPIRFEDSNTSPEVSLAYAATQDVNLYATYKTGFKSGGIDNSALPSSNLLGFASPDPAVRQSTAESLIFASETASGGEVGVKSQWLDRRLTLNASVYHYTFEDLQLQNFNPVAIQFITSNAGELTTKGFDMDFRWRGLVEGLLQVYGSLAYTDAKFTKSFIPEPIAAPLVDLEGRRSAGAPEWTGNVAADLSLPATDWLEFRLTGNLRFSSRYFVRAAAPDDYVQSGFAAADLAVSAGSPDGRWQLAIIGTNLTDKDVVVRSAPRPFLPAGGDDQVLNFAEGRKLTLQLSTKF